MDPHMDSSRIDFCFHHGMSHNLVRANMSKRRKLESTVAAIQRQYGPQALQRGAARSVYPMPVSLSTGFPPLDELTGCGGIPRTGITLLGGRATSGKLTIAYKCLVAGQVRGNVALVDLAGSSDPDYLARCGVDLEKLFWVRPRPNTDLVSLVGDLVQTGQLSLLVIDSVADLFRQGRQTRQWRHHLSPLLAALRQQQCGLLVIEEPTPPWLRWLGLDAAAQIRPQALLHIELRRERWLTDDGELKGYQVQAHLHRSRWAPSGRTAQLGIHFNGTVKAASTW